MRTLLIGISAAALGLAGCVTSAAVGRCPPKAKVAAKAKAQVAAKRKAPPKAATAAKTAAKPAADHAPALATLLAKAKATHKPLFIEFSTSWCSACKTFDRFIAPAKPVTFLLQKTIHVVYDAERGAGRAAADRFAVDGYPTFLLFAPSGHVVWSHFGMTDTPADFADDLETGLARTLSPKAIAAMAAKHPSGLTRLLIAAWDVRNAKTDDARRQLRAAARSDPKGAQGIAPRALKLRLALERGARFGQSVEQEDLTVIRRYPASDAAWTAFVEVTTMTPMGSPAARTAAAEIVQAEAHRPRVLNNLVYDLINFGMPKLAVMAARAQVKAKPGDYNAYDTLGEALDANGQAKAAARAGAKSVKMARAHKVKAQIMKVLVADQARYAKGVPSPSTAIALRNGDRNRAAYRVALAHVDMPTLLRGAEPKWHPSPQTRFDVNFSRAAYAVSKACQTDAGKLTFAWVVLRLEVAGGAPASVRMNDPHASAALASCLLRNLRGVKFPPNPAMRYAGDQYVRVMPVPLKP